MDPTTRFIADVTVALVAGGLAGAAARALRVTPVLGYLSAGMIVGPFTPGYVAHGDSLTGLAQLGLIFLLYSLGLGFSPQQLREAGIRAVVGNVLAMAVIAVAVWFIASRLHLQHPWTLALAFTVSSTAVGAALLHVFGLTQARAGRIALSMLIVQDLIAVLLLVVTSAPASELSVTGLMLPLLRAALFVIVALVLGSTVLHRFFSVVLMRAGADLPLIIFSAVALAAAWLGHFAGLTYEFGAFVAGAVTSEAAGSRLVQSVVHPFRELFIMLFFVSMGMLVDVGSLGRNLGLVLAIAAVAVGVRFIIWGGVARWLRLPLGTSIGLGIVLLPMGEFNIVLGNASLAGGRLDRVELSVLVGAAVVSIIAAAIGARVAQRRIASMFGGRSGTYDGAGGAPVVILGYGRVGQTVAEMLRQSAIDVTVVEHDPALVRSAQARGVAAVYGDAVNPRLLSQLITNATRVVLVTVPEPAATAAVTRHVRKTSSEAHIVARAASSDEADRLKSQGAADALVPELEGARAFRDAVLHALRKDAADGGPQE
jgi:CPA2 family monovalent cation:H+ antiporter-2